MKVLVMHDNKGNIRSIGVSATTAGGPVKLHAREGHVVTEVDVPDLKHEEDHEHLEKLKAKFRVEVSSKPPKLVQK